MENFSLLILCAGFGKRMLDLTIDTPKPLLKIDSNTTLLGNAINFFMDLGCKEIFINSHYLHRKIENYIKQEFLNYPIEVVYEPLILGTGGAIKNIFNYTKNKNICVINSDIFWLKDNKVDILNFLKDLDHVTHCKILLSENNNFYGLKKQKGDFNLINGNVTNWSEGNDVLFYSGIQIVSKNIFKNTHTNFPMNEIWNKLIINKKLKGTLVTSKILHIGDKNSFHNL